MPNTYQLRAIERRLAEDHRTHELGVHLAVRGGRLFVSGTVSSEESRSAVLEVVREGRDGLEVVDDLVCEEAALRHPPTTSEEIS